MWKTHLNYIYNELHDNGSKKQFYDRVNESVHKENVYPVMSVQYVITAENKQHKNKAAGPDGIKIASFMYGNLRLYVHCAHMFNLFSQVWLFAC